MKFCAGIRDPLRVNFNNLGDPLNFHPAPPSSFKLSKTLVYEQFAAKQMTFPSAPAVLSANGSMQT